MAFGSSVFLIAVGAILTFAVDATVSGLDLDVLGVILMVAGLVGVLVSLIWLDRWTAPRVTRTRRVVVDERPHRRI